MMKASNRLTLTAVLLLALFALAPPARANHSLAYSAASGSTYAWEGSHAGVNTGNGNKLTRIPIVAWTAKGGMPVSLDLTHNSQSSHNSELGQKFTFSYDEFLVVDISGNAVVHWGNDLAYQFTKSGSTYSPPTGIFDTFVSNGSPITSYDLTTKDQIKHHFTNPNGTGWYVSTISDTTEIRSRSIVTPRTM